MCHYPTTSIRVLPTIRGWITGYSGIAGDSLLQRLTKKTGPTRGHPAWDGRLGRMRDTVKSLAESDTRCSVRRGVACGTRRQFPKAVSSGNHLRDHHRRRPATSRLDPAGGRSQGPLKTTPSFITKAMFFIRLMSASGSPFTATMSAIFFSSMVPSRSSILSSRALTSVAD